MDCVTHRCAKLRSQVTPGAVPFLGSPWTLPYLISIPHTWPECFLVFLHVCCFVGPHRPSNSAFPSLQRSASQMLGSSESPEGLVKTPISGLDP